MRRACGRLGSRAAAEAVEDASDVHVDGAWRDEERSRDLAVGASVGDEAQYF